jgi:hypothetical protein
MSTKRRPWVEPRSAHSRFVSLSYQPHTSLKVPPPNSEIGTKLFRSTFLHGKKPAWPRTHLTLLMRSVGGTAPAGAPIYTVVATRPMRAITPTKRFKEPTSVVVLGGGFVERPPQSCGTPVSPW